MGTRSRTNFFNDNKPVFSMCRHYDGYISGHGKELAEFLSSKEIVNGISFDHDESKVANGFGCLAAQMVAHFKNGPGGIYLEPVREHGAPVHRETYEYEYDINASEAGTLVTVWRWDEKIFSGTLGDFSVFEETEE